MPMSACSDAIAQGIVPGPRMLVATRALVATGSYGPKTDEPEAPLLGRRGSGRAGPRRRRAPPDRRRRRRGQVLCRLSLAARRAEPADLHPGGDARRGRGGPRAPAGSSPPTPRPPEGMRRAILAGVDTIEHGNDGTPEIFRLMRAHGTALCPTLAATDAIARYRGWTGAAPEPEAIARQARQLRRGAGGGRHDLHGRRRRRLPAWRECARDGADGGLGHAPGRRADRRHLGQCPASSTSPTGSAPSAPACSPISSRSTAIRPATSTPSAPIRLVMKGGAIVREEAR